MGKGGPLETKQFISVWNIFVRANTNKQTGCTAYDDDDGGEQVVVEGRQKSACMVARSFTHQFTWDGRVCEPPPRPRHPRRLPRATGHISSIIPIYVSILLFFYPIGQGFSDRSPSSPLLVLRGTFM